jgi:hypothetical protein
MLAHLSQLQWPNWPLSRTPTTEFSSRLESTIELLPSLSPTPLACACSRLRALARPFQALPPLRPNRSAPEIFFRSIICYPICTSACASNKLIRVIRANLLKPLFDRYFRTVKKFSDAWDRSACRGAEESFPPPPVPNGETGKIYLIKT